MKESKLNRFQNAKRKKRTDWKVERIIYIYINQIACYETDVMPRTRSKSCVHRGVGIICV